MKEGCMMSEDERFMKNDIHYSSFIVIIAASILMILVSNYNFLLFHTISELLCTVIAASICIISVNTYEFNKDSGLLHIGICHGLAGTINLLHIIFYIGIFTFGNNTINLSMQVAVATRFIESLSLLIILYFPSLQKQIKVPAFSFLIAALCLVMLFLIYSSYFFQCYIAGEGYTFFKKACEAIFLIFSFLTLYFLYKNKSNYPNSYFAYFCLCIISRIIYELFFIVSIDFKTFPNVFGHVFKLISYYFLYKAVVASFLKSPYRALKVKNKEMKRINNLLKEEMLENEEVRFELKNQYELLRATLDSIPNPIFFKNAKGVYDECNKAFEKCFGLEKEDIIGKTIFEIEDRLKAARLCQIDSLINIDREAEYYECEFEYADGKNHYVVLNRGVITDDLGKTTGLVGVVMDITERKKLEENQKLFNQIKEVDRIKTEFFSNISHELRTPLNVLLGALQLMELHISKRESCIEVNKIVRYSHMMKQNCYRLLRLVNNLIDITKMDSGYFKLSLKNNDIVRIVEDITMSVAEYIENKGLGLKFDTNVEERFIAFDCDKMERIMLNLLSNAVKFTKPGGNIFVSIIAKQDKIIIAVKDDGIGIPQDKRREIFDRFFQVDDLMTRKREGSGIGLSLVKAIVEMHCGNIYVESEEGKGSEFFVELPVRMIATSEGSVYDNSHIKSSNIERIKIEFSDIYA